MAKQTSSKGYSLVELSIAIIIISLIISSVIGADLIISKTRISSAKTLTQSSPIASHKSLELWLEPVLDSSINTDEAEDGASISVWKDNNPLSVSKRNATQTTSANQPTYSNTINRIHAIKFDGTDSLMTVDGSALNNSDYTVIVVEKRLSDKDDNYFIGDSAITTENENLLLGYSLDNRIIHSQAGDNSYTTNLNTFASEANPRILVFTSSSTAGKETYINGILGATSSDTSQLSNITNLTIGKAYNGEIAEIAIFRKALNSDSRKDIEKYLGKKYAIKEISK